MLKWSFSALMKDSAHYSIPTWGMTYMSVCGLDSSDDMYVICSASSIQLTMVLSHATYLPI